MRCTLCMVSKFILIFFFSPSNVKHKCFIFRKRKRERANTFEMENGCDRVVRQRWSVGPYLALSVFIWHYYSPGNKFWHVKISDNSDIKFNQWRLLSPPRLSAQQLGPLIVPKSKPMGFCIIVQQQWRSVGSRAVAMQLYGVNVNGKIKHCFIKHYSTDILSNGVHVYL